MKKSIVFIIAGFILMTGVSLSASAGYASDNPGVAVTELPDKDPKSGKTESKKEKGSCCDKKAESKSDKNCCSSKSASSGKDCKESGNGDKKQGCSDKKEGASSAAPQTRPESETASAKANAAGSGSNCSRTKCQ